MDEEGKNKGRKWRGGAERQRRAGTGLLRAPGKIQEVTASATAVLQTGIFKKQTLLVYLGVGKPRGTNSTSPTQKRQSAQTQIRLCYTMGWRGCPPLSDA